LTSSGDLPLREEASNGVKMAGIITLLTDFGTEDSYVGAMKGIILSLHPGVTIVDISHNVPPQDVTSGSFVLSHAAPFFPKGTVHMAVVDPGVGGKRKPILIETEKYFFVGPDNGIFDMALQREKVKQIILLTNKKYFLGYVSPTFHGRDKFAPVSAYLSLGVDPSLFGKRTQSINKLEFKQPPIHNGKITGQIIHIDRFGNLITNIDEGLLRRVFKNKAFQTEVGHIIIKKLVPSYAYAKDGDVACLIGGCGLLEIAVKNKTASKALMITRGTRVEVSSNYKTL